MGAVRSLARSQTTVDTVTWTAIVAPVVGNHVTLVAATDMKYRTNDGSSLTEFTLNAGVEKRFDLTGRDRASGFIPGETVVFAQAVAGTGPVLADWS